MNKYNIITNITYEDRPINSLFYINMSSEISKIIIGQSHYVYYFNEKIFNRKNKRVNYMNFFRVY